MMYYELAKDRKTYTRTSNILSSSQKPITESREIPKHWSAFGRPIQYHGEPGMLGKTNTWMLGAHGDEDYRRIELTIFWPIRVLETIRV